MKKLCYLSTILFFFLSTSYIYAQSKSDFNLSISPFIVEIEATAPAQPESDIVIQNKSEKDATLDISLKPFTQDGAGLGQIVYFDTKEASTKLSKISNKITILENDIAVSKVKLAPLESKTLKLKIDVDDDFLATDHYFTVLFSSSLGQAKSTSKSAVNASGGIGTHVILTAGQKKLINGHISEFSASSLKSHGPVAFKLLLTNTGERYVIPRGHIEISNILGGSKENVNILPQYLLTGSKRYLTDSEMKGLASHEIIWSEKFLMGIYKATAIITLSDQGPTLKSTTYFIGVPFIILLGFSIAAFVACGIILRVRAKLKKNRKLASE